MRVNRRKSAAVLAVGASFCLSWVTGTGAAGADVQGFFDQVHRVGYSNPGGDLQMLTQGQWLCASADSGASLSTLIGTVKLMSALDEFNSIRFVVISINQLCPWNARLIQVEQQQGGMQIA